MKKPGATSAGKQAGTALLMLAVLVPFSLAIGEIYVDPSDPGFGSRDFPRLLAILGIGLSLVLLAQAAVTLWRDRRGVIGSLRESAPRLAGPAAVAAAAGLYIWAIILFQYALPTLAMMVFLIRFFGGRGVLKTLVVPAVAVALYYLVFFVILGVFEEPGSILTYDTYSLARELRQFLGLN